MSDSVADCGDHHQDDDKNDKLLSEPVVKKNPKKYQYGRCFVVGCENYLYTKRPPGAPRIQYFSSRRKVFSDELRAEWVKLVPPKPALRDPTKRWTKFDCWNDHHHVCQEHFEDKYIIKNFSFTLGEKTFSTPLSQFRLTKDAAPTIFPGGVKIRDFRNLEEERTGRRGKRLRRRFIPLEERVPHLEATSEPLDDDFYPLDPPDEDLNDNFCSICLEELPGLKRVNARRRAAYLQYIRVIGRYLGLNLQKAEEVLGREGSGNGMSMICRSCGVRAERICKLFEELEVIRIKLDDAIWRLSEDVFETGEWSERRRKMVEGVMGEKPEVKHMLEVTEGIQMKRNILRKPRVILKRLEEEDDQKEVMGAHGVDEVIVVPESDLVCGRSSLLNILGFRKNIFRCPSCHKCYSSKADLRHHKNIHHSAPGRRWAPEPEESEPEEYPDDNYFDEDEGLSPPIAIEPGEDAIVRPSSPPPITPTVVESPPLRTPTLVLNDNLLEKSTQVKQESQPEMDSQPVNDTALTRCPSPAVSGATPIDLVDISSEPTTVNPFAPELEPAVPIPPLPEAPEMETDNHKEDETSTPLPQKKVPFMSSEYIGKYKILCKLKNLTTGETCMGVVAKSSNPPPPGEESSKSVPSAASNEGVPKVISVEPEPARKLRIPGPPFKCPLDTCTTQYTSRYQCVRHYRLHKQRLARIQKLRDDGEDFVILKSGALKILPKPEPPPENEFYCKYNKKFCRRRIFKNQSLLDRHYILKHTPYPCHFCSDPFPNVTLLVTHELSEHSPQETDSSKNTAYSERTCPRCLQTTGSRASLRNHYATVHLNIKLPKQGICSVKCGICNRTFYHILKYTRHMKKTHGNEGEALLEKELPFKCDQCDHRVRTEAVLQKHKKFSHGGVRRRKSVIPVMKCNICGKVFTRHRYLFEEHVRSHSIEESGGGLEEVISGEMCETCGKTFKNPILLRQHKRVHDPSLRKAKKPSQKFEMPAEGLVCHHCGKRFTHLRGYRLHLYYHRTDRPQYPCQLCGKIWPNRAQLEYHLRRVHPADAERFEIRPENGVVCDQCGKVLKSKYNLQGHLKHCPVAKEMKREKEKTNE